MKPILFGTALVLLSGMAATASAQTGMDRTATVTGPAYGTASADPEALGPITGIPGNDAAVASSCTETELSRARSLVEQAPSELQSSAEVIWSTANEFQNDNERDLCATKLHELAVLAQAGQQGVAGVSLRATGSGPGYLVSPEGMPLAAASCTELDLAQAAGVIDQAPSSMRSGLQQRFERANEQQNENELQSCSQNLAVINDIADGEMAGMVASPE